MNAARTRTRRRTVTTNEIAKVETLGNFARAARPDTVASITSKEGIVDERGLDAGEYLTGRKVGWEGVRGLGGENLGKAGICSRF